MSPTTVSGIETGRISRPHFGTVRKLARALGVEPEELLSLGAEAGADGEVSAPLSLEWAVTVREEEFDRGLEDASLENLSSLEKELGEEQERLRRLYVEFPRGSEQQRFIRRQIRNLAAHSGSVGASITSHEHGRSRRGKAADG